VPLSRPTGSRRPPSRVRSSSSATIAPSATDARELSGNAAQARTKKEAARSARHWVDARLLMLLPWSPSKFLDDRPGRSTIGASHNSGRGPAAPGWRPSGRLRSPLNATPAVERRSPTPSAALVARRDGCRRRLPIAATPVS
jgi:hypothetical protein